MQTLQPTLRLGRDVWNREAMPIEEFTERARRLRATMTERGLDALLLFGSNLNGCGAPTYLANYIVKLPFAALVVLPRNGPPALIFQGATRGRSAAQATTWIEDVRPCWNMADMCLTVLAERRLTKARLGLVAMPRLVPHGQWTTLAAGLADATLVNADAIVDRQRAIKSEREIAQIERASRIVRDGMTSIARGTTTAGEWRLVVDVIREARMRGAEDIRVMVARLQESEWAFRPVEDVAFREGESVSVMLAASWERYWSQSIRTFRVAAGRFQPPGGGAIDAAFDALKAGLRRGVTTGQWSRSTLAAMSTSARSAIAPYGLGAGIGITPEEWPPLSPDDETPMEHGMCFGLRGAFGSNDGLMLHGDTVVV